MKEESSPTEESPDIRSLAEALPPHACLPWVRKGDWIMANGGKPFPGAMPAYPVGVIGLREMEEEEGPILDFIVALANGTMENPKES